MGYEQMMTDLQVVILCGGLGTRLRPLTESLPKPMAPVNGRPFLEHLMRQLSDQGLRRFTLLTGYLGETIRAHFGDGARWGWRIDYSHGPAEWDTGRRVHEVRTKLDPEFLLLYSDNFVQFNLPRLLALHRRQGTPISLLLSPKEKGNIRIAQDGTVLAYDKARKGKGFDYVEVGYMLVDRDRMLGDLGRCPGYPDINFSALLERYAANAGLSGLIVRDPYHSISDLHRLSLMERYLAPKKILLIDRDGTINVKAEPGQYIADWGSFQWEPHTRSAMKRLAAHGFEFIVITNQAGIARGMVSAESVQDIHSRMVEDLARDGVVVRAVYMSPHHWDENSFLRKPAPGMFFEAAREHLLRMDHCLYVGDDERDCVAAANAGCGMVYLSHQTQPLNLPEKPNPYLKSASLLDCVDSIIRQYHAWEVENDVHP